MNKNIITFATIMLAAATFAAPGRGGNHSSGHGQRNSPSMQRSAPSGRSSSRPANNHSPHAGKSTAHHSTPTAHHSAPTVHHSTPVAHHKPLHSHFGSRPRATRHWARPAMPPPVRPYALYGWTWIASPWTILVNGVYCSGDGYWFDGYNYYYNDAYYTSAPVSISISF